MSFRARYYASQNRALRRQSTTGSPTNCARWPTNFFLTPGCVGVACSAHKPCAGSSANIAVATRLVNANLAISNPRALDAGLSRRNVASRDSHTAGGHCMRQVLQCAHNGEIAIADVPTPKLLPGCALVRTAASLVSAGTERAVAQFAGKNLFQKASARPDLVREVVNKVRRDGLFSAVQAVRSRLDQPLAAGYSSAGTVVAVHESVTDINVGDRVACAGAGYARHAEMACSPRLLMARIPNGSDVSFEEAAFSKIGGV